jgi:hypothetical protein
MLLIKRSPKSKPKYTRDRLAALKITDVRKITATNGLAANICNLENSPHY